MLMGPGDLKETSSCSVQQPDSPGVGEDSTAEERETISGVGLQLNIADDEYRRQEGAPFPDPDRPLTEEASRC